MKTFIVFDFIDVAIINRHIFPLITEYRNISITDRYTDNGINGQNIVIHNKCSMTCVNN